MWLVQGAAIFIYIAAPCTTEIHAENQHLTLLVKPRVQPRFLHRLLILCFSCNPVIPKNKKSPKHFPFSVKIPIFASVPRAERSNAAKPAQLPNRYRLPNFLLFKSYLPTDYKKTIVFAKKILNYKGFVSGGSSETMSWLFIRKLICLHKGKIKFAYKEEQKLVLILIFPIVIRQSERVSEFSGILSVPELSTGNSELLSVTGMLPTVKTSEQKRPDKKKEKHSLVLVERNKDL